MRLSRVVAVILVVPLTYFFVYWFLLSFVPLGEQIAGAVSWLCAIAAGWCVWVNFTPEHHGALSSTILGAILFGSLGFAVGIAGPLKYTPEANLGPLLLLSILITAPLGFAVGGIAGFLYWLSRRRIAEVELAAISVLLFMPPPRLLYRRFHTSVRRIARVGYSTAVSFGSNCKLRNFPSRPSFTQALTQKCSPLIVALPLCVGWLSFSFRSLRLKMPLISRCSLTACSSFVVRNARFMRNKGLSAGYNEQTLWAAN